MINEFIKFDVNLQDNTIMKNLHFLFFLLFVKNGSSNTALNYKKDSLFDIYVILLQIDYGKCTPNGRQSSNGYQANTLAFKKFNKTTLNDELKFSKQ